MGDTLNREQMPAVVLEALDRLNAPMDAVVSVTLDRNPFHVVPGGSWHVLLWCGMPEARNTVLLEALQAVETRCEGVVHTAVVEVDKDIVAFAGID